MRARSRDHGWFWRWQNYLLTWDQNSANVAIWFMGIYGSGEVHALVEIQLWEDTAKGKTWNVVNSNWKHVFHWPPPALTSREPKCFTGTSSTKPEASGIAMVCHRGLKWTRLGVTDWQFFDATIVWPRGPPGVLGFGRWVLAWLMVLTCQKERSGIRCFVSSNINSQCWRTLSVVPRWSNSTNELIPVVSTCFRSNMNLSPSFSMYIWRDRRIWQNLIPYVFGGIAVSITSSLLFRDTPYSCWFIISCHVYI